jgi:hypothetical protein
MLGRVLIEPELLLGRVEALGREDVDGRVPTTLPFDGLVPETLPLGRVLDTPGRLDTAPPGLVLPTPP